jgi:hypothetical protein
VRSDSGEAIRLPASRLYYFVELAFGPAISGRTRCARNDASGTLLTIRTSSSPIARGRIKNSVLATGHVRALLTTTHQIDSLPSHDPEKAVSGFRTRSCAQKREAERRKAHAIHVRVIANKCCAVCATYLLRGCAPFRGAPAFRRSRLRHSPKASTPMAQPQNRVSRRRTELGCFARSA